MNSEETYKGDVINYLKKSIGTDLAKNNKLQILIDEFNSISLNYDKSKIAEALEIINNLSDLLNSSK
jgi:uncharacterized membrane protein YvbJ